MSKKYLVTGGSGFIGSALVKALVKQGQKVRVADNNFRGSLRRLEEVLDDIEFIELDIRDPEAVARACIGVDSVCHLAYINGTERFYTQPELVLEVGVKGMLNVLDGCRAAGVGELVLMSSSEVYQTPPVIPTPETVPLIVPDPLEARYSYGGGKIISELLAVNYGRQGFSRVMIIRPHNVYGPDMGFEHVIPQFALRLRDLITQSGTDNVIPFPIQGTGEETRAFIYIDDFVDGMGTVLSEGRHLEIYHIGNPHESSIREVAQSVAKAMDVKIEIQAGELLPGSTLRRCPDVSKLSALGFTPQTSLEQGVHRYIAWMNESELVNSNHRGSSVSTER